MSVHGGGLYLCRRGFNRLFEIGESPKICLGFDCFHGNSIDVLNIQTSMNS